jgi:indolepyruvate ferredoxin oxidoreductase
MAQKGGAVTSHIMLAAQPGDIAAIRIAPGRADLVLGCDLVVSASDVVLKTVSPASRLVVNTHQMMTGDFTRNADFRLPVALMQARLEAAVAPGAAIFVDATRLATGLMGDSIAANLFMLGVAFQKGLIPLSAAAILRAIELNGVAVDFNRQSFAWGRLWGADRAAVEARVGSARPVVPVEEQDLDSLVARRVADLTGYQNARYAARYKALVDRVAAADPAPDKALARAVARTAHRLMAYKDEYEVARLYSDGRFAAALAEQFEGDFTLRLHLAPPLLARRDKVTGHLQKRDFGPWVLRLMPLLARLRLLRGTPFDPFGRTAERRMERGLIAEYFATVEQILAELPQADYAGLVALAALPERIRGFGHVKEANAAAVAGARQDLLARLRPAAAPAPEPARKAG